MPLKSLSSILNQIYDKDVQKKDKSSQPSNQPSQPAGQQRWKIPPPSRLILPPAYEPQVPEFVATSTSKPTSRTTYYNPSTATTPKPSTLRPTASTTTTTRAQGSRFNGVAALHNRNEEHLQYEHDDLGTSHSTRYNTSADFNSNEDRNIKNRQKASQRKTTSSTKHTTTATTARTTIATTKATPNPNIKVPSKIYEPPLLFPIYNLDETSSTTTTTTTTTVRPLYKASTAAPFMTRQTTVTSSPTTTRAPSRATTVIGKPFTRPSSSSATTATTKSDRGQSKFDADKLSKDIRTPAPAQGFKAATTRTSAFTNNSTSSTAIDNIPSKHLLPPLTDFIQHDVATTQGPPIYYEWKVPSDGLEPPKKEAPIGVDGRQYPDSALDYNTISSSGSNIAPIATFGIDQKKSIDTKQTSRTPISRSIKDTAQPNGVRTTSAKTSTTSKPPVQSSAAPVVPGDIFQIRKDLSVPEYAFPLENVGRTGYFASDVYNSFQLKIPERRADTDEHLHWFGENPKCPECHPSYVIPGTCEPCLRR